MTYLLSWQQQRRLKTGEGKWNGTYLKENTPSHKSVCEAILARGKVGLITFLTKLYYQYTQIAC